MNTTKSDKELSGKDIVRHNLRNKIDNLKTLIRDTESIRRETLFILDRYPNHREWKTLASFEAKSILKEARSEVRLKYKSSGQTIPSDKNIQADMMEHISREFNSRLSTLHISLEASESYLHELDNMKED